MSYVFAQCRDPRCRFRFPVVIDEVDKHPCPLCRGPVGSQAYAPTPLSDEPAAPGFVALLDNIRSIHNVGSMFRTADGAGLDMVYLAGITATPHHPRLAKAALGAQETVCWRYYTNSLDAAASLRAGGFRLWALERQPDGQPLFDAPAPSGPLAMVVGNEKAGVDPALLALCDAVYSLPMHGQKSSLNAAVAFGIAVYHVRFVMSAFAAVTVSGNALDHHRFA